MNAVPGDQPDIRASDADRNRIIDLLGEAAGEGRLTVAELEERIEAAAAARYESELQVLVQDLPVGQSPVTQRSQDLTHRANIPQVMPKVLHASWSSIVRAGAWQVPEWIVIEPAWSSIVFNMLQAIPPASRVMTVEIRGGWGSFVLIVPDGWGVDRAELAGSSTWSSKKYDALEVPAPGMPLVRLVGDARDSGVSVRGERWWDKWFHDKSRN